MIRYHKATANTCCPYVKRDIYFAYIKETTWIYEHLQVSIY
ncbi:hypothetical protein VP275E431_P0081 [Vibrio phage 275E43-1]|nr:hypothetical protein VP275E431_P0081 [Vibrio phage 275E43-1]